MICRCRQVRQWLEVAARKTRVGVNLSTAGVIPEGQRPIRNPGYSMLSFPYPLRFLFASRVNTTSKSSLIRVLKSPLING